MKTLASLISIFLMLAIVIPTCDSQDIRVLTNVHINQRWQRVPTSHEDHEGFSTRLLRRRERQTEELEVSSETEQEQWIRRTKRGKDKKTKTPKSGKAAKGDKSTKSKSGKTKQVVDPDFITERDRTSSPTSAPSSSTPRPTPAFEDTSDRNPTSSEGGPEVIIPSEDAIAPIFDAPTEEEPYVVRTIRIENSARTGTCMSFNGNAGGGNSSTNKVLMSNCTESESTNRWELLHETDELFKIRHKQSQLCLPQNPENPMSFFGCFRFSGSDEALADSINGLIPCNAKYAAILGFVDAYNPMYLYNTDCFSGSSGMGASGTDVGLMSYIHPESGDSMVLWGEKVLLDMPEYVSSYSLSAEWIFIDAD